MEPREAIDIIKMKTVFLMYVRWKLYKNLYGDAVGCNKELFWQT